MWRKLSRKFKRKYGPFKLTLEEFNSVPIGVIREYHEPSPPEGWVRCKGQLSPKSVDWLFGDKLPNRTSCVVRVK